MFLHWPVKERKGPKMGKERRLQNAIFSSCTHAGAVRRERALAWPWPGTDVCKSEGGWAEVANFKQLNQGRLVQCTCCRRLLWWQVAGTSVNATTTLTLTLGQVHRKFMCLRLQFWHACMSALLNKYCALLCSFHSFKAMFFYLVLYMYPNIPNVFYKMHDTALLKKRLI